ncbi:COMM domain-containing protein 10-like [Sarcoptes scabiei]|nr:COMM domain-containing protein 10-like [Sarcoptes scabiei]
MKEYPGSRGGKHEDKQNFVALLRELKAAFKPRNYILSAAVAAGKHFMDPAYDIPEISKHLDMINVMCYDYHGSWEKTSGHHAPLFARPDRPEDYQLNVNFSINYWISKGAPREKLILGMGTYGRAFTLRRAEDHGIGDSAPQKGQAGPYTREGGSLGYNEICEMQTKHPDMSTVWDPYYLAPYSFWGRQWVGYDNVESIAIKSQYAKAMGLGGGMIWSIETDDFGGYCNQGRYPLLRAIRKVFDDPKKAFMPKPDQQSKQPHETTKPPSTPSFPPQQTTKFPTQPSKPSSKPSYPPKKTTKFPPQTTKPSIPPQQTTKFPPQTSKPSSKSPQTTITTKILTTKPWTTTTVTQGTSTSIVTTKQPSSPSSTTRKPVTMPDSESTTNRCKRPRPTTKRTTPSTTTTQSSTEFTTLRPPSESSSTSESSKKWWSESTPWWPTKPSKHASPGITTWWAATFPPSRKNPNAIEENPSSKDSDILIMKESSQSFTCTGSGLFRNPESCTKFIRCVETDIEDQFQLFFYECPDKTVFNSKTQLCDWVENVPDCLDSVPKYYFRGINFQNKGVVAIVNKGIGVFNDDEDGEDETQ